MSELVYMLGAGFNQSVKDWDGLKPPLATNFFQTALQSEKFSDAHYTQTISEVYEYIARYWKLSREDLQRLPFDLEECFTLLELQWIEAQNKKNSERVRKLATIEFRIKSFLAEFLSEFEIFASISDLTREFGSLIYREKPILITFNYDCILESVIENASGARREIPASFRGMPSENGDIPDSELAYSHCNWNRPLGYNIKFNTLQLHRAGLSTYVDGHRFYSHPKNKLYPWYILKLHGSLNWFRYLPIRKYPPIPSLNQETELSEEKLREILHIEGHWWFAMPPEFDGWIIDPLIITPVLYKERFFQERLFADLWSQAKADLETCKHLVIIGYSFAPTDFATRRLLLEAFSENTLESMTVVNPNTSVVQIAKRLCHFEKPAIVCRDLEEYLLSRQTNF